MLYYRHRGGTDQWQIKADPNSKSLESEWEDSMDTIEPVRVITNNRSVRYTQNVVNPFPRQQVEIA